jgi:hypothetical protein
MTPIKRAARAIANIEDFGNDRFWQNYQDSARAVLMAIREPSKEIIEAGVKALSDSGVDDVRHGDALACWQAMIDAALEES